jgi:hypothetical protein
MPQYPPLHFHNDQITSLRSSLYAAESRPVLGDTTAIINDTVSQPPNPPTQKHKRQANKSSAPSKCQNTAQIASDGICGVGPTTHIELEDSDLECEHPALKSCGSLVTSLQNKKSLSVATDVWYFMCALDVKDKPSTIPETETMFHQKRPKSDYLGCRLCM